MGEISALFFTPIKVHKMLKSTYDNLIIQKLQLFTSMPELDQLKYELKNAIEKENYEKAAELRDKITALNSKDQEHSAAEPQRVQGSE